MTLMWTRAVQIVAYSAGVISAFHDRLLSALQGDNGRRIPHRRFPSPLDRLQNLLLGTTRETICEMFGPPVAVLATQPRDEVWYYPFDSVSKTALAIRFDLRAARRIELIRAPLSDRMLSGD